MGHTLMHQKVDCNNQEHIHNKMKNAQLVNRYLEHRFHTLLLKYLKSLLLTCIAQLYKLYKMEILLLQRLLLHNMYKRMFFQYQIVHIQQNKHMYYHHLDLEECLHRHFHQNKFKLVEVVCLIFNSQIRMVILNSIEL